ncbi:MULTISPECIES: hypothetical protein [unclassified Microbacterium]|uniref:hypothetical protein n=1 Tax=unclassified Microbacterium TaxID=2609290 RepID=UPI00214BE2C0|nr:MULTISPECIES: hypothetical protein [unclassified Microbacterium]MCR2809011.1 hypothetical protein [Microbacterium sp. zg.B185]WIM18578.1 hypothetical protein QNO12_13395 [Microbacterium sp. zg-B185]
MTITGRRSILAVVTFVLLVALGAGIGILVTDVVGVPGDLPVTVVERDPAMAWIARGLLLLSALWIVIGAVASRTSLVRRPGAAAARASWLGATRPWRARESTLGMLPLDRWLLLIVPAALLIATRAVQSSFRWGTHVTLVLAAWIGFVVVLRLVIGRRSPWPVIAAVGGVVVLRCIVTLVALSVDGPGGHWVAYWTDSPRSTVYIAIAFALFVWSFIAAGWALAGQIGRRRATGTILAGIGAAVFLAAVVVASTGAQAMLTAWNDELRLLPSGVARILGITVYSEIPAAAVWWAVGAGLLVTVVGVVLALPYRRRDRDAPASPEASVGLTN